MAREISMNGRKKIESIQKEFTEKFNYLTLIFLDEDMKSIDVSRSLAEVRTAKGPDISIMASLKVNTLEQRFMDSFGITVEIAYSKDGKVMHTKDSVNKTLNELNQWCEKTGCDMFFFKKALTRNTLLSTQEKLFNAIKESFPDAEAKKINKDNFLDIHLQSIHPKRGTHLFFNTAKSEIKLGFYVRDESFISLVVESASNIEQYSQGLRISGNPTFSNVEDAIEAAMGFIGEIMGNFATNESESDLLVYDEDQENGSENINKSIDEVIDDLRQFDPANMVYLSVNFQAKPLYERGKVGGSINGKQFNMDYKRTWARGYLLSDDKMNVKQLIEILENKSIQELTSSDFSGLEYGELHDYTIEYKSIKLDNKKIPESIEPEDLFSKGEVIGDVIFEFDSFDDLSINVFSEEYEANIQNEKEELFLENFTLIHTLVTVYSAFASQSGISDASLDVLLDRIKAWEWDLSEDAMKNEIMKTLRWFTKNYDASLFSKLKLKLNELSDLPENKRKDILEDLRQISNTFFEIPSAKIQLYSSIITNLGFNKNEYAIVPVTKAMLDNFNNTFDVGYKSSILENFQEEGYISLFSIDVRNLNKAIEENDFSADMLHLIGKVELQDWDSLEKLTNEEEVASIKKDFKDEKSKYIVIMYCQGKYIHAFSCPEYDEESEDGVDTNNEAKENKAIKKSTSSSKKSSSSDSIFKTVKIGKQEWLAENLNVDEFRNGDLIPEVKSQKEWENAGKSGKPAWCYYENKNINGKKYGKLYNWFAVNDPRGLAPEGWHIPSDEEWTVLTDYLGGEDLAGTKMKSNSGWEDYLDEDEGNGTNESGFSGLPGGNRISFPNFNGIGRYGCWWSSTERTIGIAWDRDLDYENGSVNRDDFSKEFGLSVRCIKD